MVKVELVHDPVVQGPEPKLDFDGVRVDPPSEILANKLCALLGRNELRDRVDACVLERSGQDLETALELASRKDRGCTPLVLADLLLAWDVGPSARVPLPLDRDALLAYRHELVDRLLRIARVVSCGRSSLPAPTITLRGRRRAVSGGPRTRNRA